jgi:hypothetical protein
MEEKEILELVKELKINKKDEVFYYNSLIPLRQQMEKNKSLQEKINFLHEEVKFIKFRYDKEKEQKINKIKKTIIEENKELQKTIDLLNRDIYLLKNNFVRCDSCQGKGLILGCHNFATICKECGSYGGHIKE